MKTLIVTLCVTFLLASAASATTPRLFVEAAVSPTNLSDVQLVRLGFTSGRLMPFFGYFHWSHEPEIDREGWKSFGDEYILGGVHWLTASPLTALFIPSLGGGALIGRMNQEFYSVEQTYPTVSYRKMPSDITTALGLFADIGLRVPIRPTGLMINTDLHWNLATISRTSNRSQLFDDEYVESRLIILSLYWLVGATYRF